MCINVWQWIPRSGPSEGRLIKGVCRGCWQCRADRVNDWAGKAIAESKTCKDVDYITLSYCDVKSRAAKWIKEPVPVGYAKELHYRDVQLYFKRIRKAGHDMRYVVAGEYGSRKGRAHWHVLIFWKNGRPDRRELYGNEWQDQFWHHGHVNYAPFSYEAARYVCKYLLKWATEKEPDRKTEFHFSTRPGIGFVWLATTWAKQHVDQGLAPQSAKYSFPEIMVGGKRRQFRMSPHAQRKFVKVFEEQWYAKWGTHPPSSDFCDRINDQMSSYTGLDCIANATKFAFLPDEKPPNGEEVFLDEKLNAYYFELGHSITQDGEGRPLRRKWFPNVPGIRFYWSFDEKGHRSWQRNLVSAREGRKRSVDYAIQSSSERHREQTHSSGARATRSAAR